MTVYVSDPDFTGDCELWPRYRDPKGYGRVTLGDRSAQLAHRVAWERTHGPIPAGMEIHHICRTPACVNVAHLQLVTPREHKAIEQAERTHCRRGHSYAEHGRFHKGTTARYCRACERENERRRDAA